MFLQNPLVSKMKFTFRLEGPTKISVFIYLTLRFKKALLSTTNSFTILNSLSCHTLYKTWVTINPARSTNMSVKIKTIIVIVICKLENVIFLESIEII